jgi:hypothetical protein
MSNARTIQRRLTRDLGFVFTKQLCLTPEQAATVQQWDATNRAKALGEDRTTATGGAE